MKIDPKYIAENNCGIDCPVGWEFLVEEIIKTVENHQKTYLKLKTPDPQRSYAGSDRGLYEIKLEQVKEKFGGLRVYYYVKPIEQDWNRFDSEDAKQRIARLIQNLRGFVDAIGMFSFHICEVTGERGSLCRRGGWYKTLSPKEAEKQGYEPTSSNNTL